MGRVSQWIIWKFSVEDPWAELEQGYGYRDSYDSRDHSVPESLSALAGEGDTSTVQKDSMSESLIVQVGDSLCERNDKILDTTEDAEDTESQSQSDDKWNILY